MRQEKLLPTFLKKATSLQLHALQLMSLNINYTVLILKASVAHRQDQLISEHPGNTHMLFPYIGITFIFLF